MNDGRWKYRTAKGIADQIHASPNAVLRVLGTHPDIARRTPLSSDDGDAVWTKASARRTWREWLAGLRLVLARESKSDVVLPG